MYSPGKQLLSGAAFSGDKHRGLVFRHLADKIKHMGHGLTSGNNVSKRVFFFDLINFCFQPDVFLF